MAMDFSRLIDPNVQAHPILMETYRTIPRLKPRPATPGMITITNILITPTGDVVPAFREQRQQHRAGRIPRKLLINSRDYPVHLRQTNNANAHITALPPHPTPVHLLPTGIRSLEVDSSTPTARFSSETTGYHYPSSELGICNEPYHLRAEAPHGPSHRCTQCPTRLPFTPTLRSFRLSAPAHATTIDGQTPPNALCTACPPITTSILKLDYPTAFAPQTAPLCDDCTSTYLRVRARLIPDPTSLSALNARCQCHVFINHIANGWVCYMCKWEECRRRVDLAALDLERHRGLMGGWTRRAVLDCGYNCKCGKVVRGDFGVRRWSRCVVCERVVDDGVDENGVVKEVVYDD